jgi:hypothetical protein
MVNQFDGIAASTAAIRADIYNTIWWEGFALGAGVVTVVIIVGWMVWATAVKHVRSLHKAGADLDIYYPEIER